MRKIGLTGAKGGQDTEGLAFLVLPLVSKPGDKLESPITLYSGET